MALNVVDGAPIDGLALDCSSRMTNPPATGSNPTEPRFGFGDNWSDFATTVDEESVREAERSLLEMLGAGALQSKRFLDIGCGSGIFSLSAIRLGAAEVHSFDFDRASVATTERLREAFLPGSPKWTIEHGDVLDEEYLARLGKFDIVYAWGVLHHTGHLEKALANAGGSVAEGGRLFLSIYNDQGPRSSIWKRIKRLYCALPPALRTSYVATVMLPREILSFAAHALRRQPMAYVRTWTEYKRRRGMSRWHDLVDWVGGYPFEVATPQAIFRLYRDQGFVLEEITTGRGLGCNEFVFTRPA